MFQTIFALRRPQHVPSLRSQEESAAHPQTRSVCAFEAQTSALTFRMNAFTLKKQRVVTPRAIMAPPILTPAPRVFDVSQICSGDIIVVQDEKPLSQTTWMRWVIRIGQKMFGLWEHNRRVHTSVVVPPRGDEPADRLYIVEGDSPSAVRVPLADLIERERLTSSLLVYRFAHPVAAETVASVATLMQSDGTPYFGKYDFVRSAMKRAHVDVMTDHLPERANCSTLAAFAINAGLAAEEDLAHLDRHTYARARLPTSPQILSAAFDSGELPYTLAGTIAPQKTSGG